MIEGIDPFYAEVYGIRQSEASCTRIARFASTPVVPTLLTSEVGVVPRRLR